jgi:SynChlorMet cassette radical SAM/SPASM protein ScmF
VKLTGGEPTIHPQFRDIVSFIEEEKLNVTMESNGILIDEDLARFLKGMSRFSFISISLDGAKPETHDRMRGVVGSFRQAVSGIKHLVSAGFRPQIICTLHRGNVSEMTDVISLAENLGCGSVKFNLVQKIGRGQGFASKQGLAIAEIIRLNRQVETDIIPKHKITVYFDIPFAFYPIQKMLKGSLGRCGILNVLGLLSGGEMALCGIGTTQPELVYGHIADDDLKKVWCENPKLVRLREQIPSQLEGICAQCLHRDICLGTCVANNFHESGKLNAPYYFCQKANELGLFPFSRQKGGKKVASRAGE